MIVSPLLAPFLAEAGVVVLDGGLATELERRGADLRDPLWSAKLLLDDPDLIRQVHLDYYRAGADVATTASYQATLPALQARGLSAVQAANALCRSVALACAARAEFWHEPPPGRLRPLVAASVGSYGAAQHDGSEYRGDYGLTVRQLADWHRPRFNLLADSGADLLACETIPCLREAEALARLLEERPDVPAWVSFSCRDGRHLAQGEPLTAAVDRLNSVANVVALGVNCTPPRYVSELLAAAAPRAQRPLVVYPNRGETWDAAQGAWGARDAALDWGTAARAWHTAGARLIGGCCRTTPDDIRQLAQAFPRLRVSASCPDTSR